MAPMHQGNAGAVNYRETLFAGKPIDADIPVKLNLQAFSCWEAELQDAKSAWFPPGDPLEKNKICNRGSWHVLIWKRWFTVLVTERINFSEGNLELNRSAVSEVLSYD